MTIKTIYLPLLPFILISISGCESKVIYATPQITGQVIDKQTNQPVEGVNTPNHREAMSIGNTSFSINKPDYEIKSYANGGLAFIPKPYTEKRYIDMGQGYLMPVPVGKERDYKTYYQTLDYCKSNQSQKEVDCIPVPDGKTYDQVSPNRPINSAQQKTAQ